MRVKNECQEKETEMFDIKYRVAANPTVRVISAQLYLVQYTSGVRGTLSNISNTRKSVSSDIQTLRSGLKKRGAAEFF